MAKCAQVHKEESTSQGRGEFHPPCIAKCAQMRACEDKTKEVKGSQRGCWKKLYSPLPLKCAHATNKSTSQRHLKKFHPPDHRKCAQTRKVNGQQSKNVGSSSFTPCKMRPSSSYAQMRHEKSKVWSEKW